MPLSGAVSARSGTPPASSPANGATTLQRDAAVYNHLIPQRNIGHTTPVEALRNWYAKQPELFVFDPNNLPGPDTYGILSQHTPLGSALPGAVPGEVIKVRLPTGVDRVKILELRGPAVVGGAARDGRV